MIFDLKFEPYQIKENTQFFCKVDGQNDFPVLMIDKDSYIVKATVETGLDFQGKDMVYNLQIGKYSSLAEDIFFMININHDYRSVFQGCIKELRNFSEKEIRIKRKGQILIANDCWIGHGAMIMSGVTIHNGAIVAANAVVTKDVPPYAVVAGNPAKVVKYRFTQKEISALLKIAWWEWNTEKLKSCVKDFMGEVSEFIQKHIEAAEADLIEFTQRKNPIQRLIDRGGTYAFCVDLYEPFPICFHVIKEFCEKFRNMDGQLILYIGNMISDKLKTYNKLIEFLKKFQDVDCCIQIVDEADVTIRDIIRNTDIYITNRSRENLYAVSLAEFYNKKVLSGVDRPIFD